MYLNRQAGVALLPLLALTVTTGCTSLATEHDAARAFAEPLADHAIISGEVPDPSKVRSTVEASGCGEFKYFPDVENESFDITTGTDPFLEGNGESRCTLTLHYEFPAGWTFDAPRMIALGAMVIGPGANVALTLTSGLGRGTPTVTQRFGEYTDTNFTLILDERSAASGGSVPCGATSADLRVQVTAKTTGGDGGDYIILDGIHSVMNWRRCP